MRVLQVVLFLCACTLSYGGLFQQEHPQLAFCKADFVIRAVVVSGPTTEGHYDVYTISIREVFKGLANGPQERAFGVLEQSLTTELYTPSQVSTHMSGQFGIKNGTEYSMYGVIQEGKLFTSFSFLRKPWHRVTPRQKANLRGYYEAGCRQCRLKKCSGKSDPKCKEKLPGCEKKQQQVGYSLKAVCWKELEHCEVDETGQRCEWKENSESKKCREYPYKWLRW